MKNIILLNMLLFCFSQGFAEQNSESHDKVWFDGTSLIYITNSYIQPIIEYAIDANDNTNIVFGGNGAIVFNNRFAVGCAGYITKEKTETYLEKITDKLTEVEISVGYGGIVLDYTFFETKYIDFSLPILIGGGRSQIKKVDEEVNGINFWIIIPSINLEFKVFDKVSFNLSAKYLNVLNPEYDKTSKFEEDIEDYSGYSAAFSLKLYFH